MFRYVFLAVAAIATFQIPGYAQNLAEPNPGENLVSSARAGDQHNDPSVNCKIPAVAPGAQVSFYSSSGGAFPTVTFVTPKLDGALDMRATKISIRNDQKPVYLFLSSADPMVWHIEGNTATIQHVVVAGKPYGDKQFSAVTNVSPEKVTFVSQDKCLPYFATNGDDYTYAREAIRRLTGTEPHIQATAKNAAAIENFDDHFVLIEKGKTEDAPAANIFAALRRAFTANMPGGVVSVEPSKLTTDIPVENLTLLPGSAGLAQLIRQGSVTPTSNGPRTTIVMEKPVHRDASLEEAVAVEIPANYRIIKHINALPQLYKDGISPEFSLAPGVAAPTINPGYCIVSEETGETIEGAICETRHGGMSLAKVRGLPDPLPASAYDDIPEAAAEFLGGGVRQDTMPGKIRRFFKTVDNNNDGLVSKQDYAGGFIAGAGEAAFRESKRSERLMKFDNDKNGKVTPEEIEMTMMKVFPTIDTDRDGLINTVEERAVYTAFRAREKLPPCRPPAPSPEAQFVFIDIRSAVYFSSISLMDSRDTRAARIIVGQDSTKPVYIMANSISPTLWDIQDPGKRVERIIINGLVGHKKIAVGVKGVDADKIVFQGMPACFYESGAEANVQRLANQVTTIKAMVDRAPDNHLFSAEGGTITIGDGIATEVIERWVPGQPMPFGMSESQWSVTIRGEAGIVVDASLSDVVTPTKATIVTGPPRDLNNRLRKMGTASTPTRTARKNPPPAQKHNEHILAPNPFECVFKQLVIVPDVKVFAYGAYQGQGEGASRTINVKIEGAAGEPIGLVLSSHTENTWHVDPQGARIVAVLLTGYGPQNIIGLEKDTPILGLFRREKEGNFCSKTLDYDSIAWLNPMARRYFGKNVHTVMMDYEPKGSVVIDTRAAVTPFDPQVSQFDYDRTRSKRRPVPQVVQDLVDTGALRHASTQDLKDWSKAVRILNPKYKDVPPVMGHPDEELLIGAPYDFSDHYEPIYVIQKALTVTKPLDMAGPGLYLLPKGVPYPDGDFERISIFDFENGSCSGSCREWAK